VQKVVKPFTSAEDMFADVAQVISQRAIEASSDSPSDDYCQSDDDDDDSEDSVDTQELQKELARLKRASSEARIRLSSHPWGRSQSMGAV